VLGRDDHAFERPRIQPSELIDHGVVFGRQDDVRAKKPDTGDGRTIVVDVRARAERRDPFLGDSPTEKDVFVGFPVEIREGACIVGALDAPDVRR
jgi:hypothetical protein